MSSGEEDRTIGWDEATRPHVTPAGGAAAEGMGSHLVLIHDMFRRQLEALCEVRDQVRAGLVDLDRAAIRLVTAGEGFEEIDRFVDVLASGLLSHLRYEEDQLVRPISDNRLVI